MKVKVTDGASRNPRAFARVYNRLLNHCRTTRRYDGKVKVGVAEYRTLTKLAKMLASCEDLTLKQARNLIINLAVARILGMVSADSIKVGLSKRLAGKAA